MHVYESTLVSVTWSSNLDYHVGGTLYRLLTQDIRFLIALPLNMSQRLNKWKCRTLYLSVTAAVTTQARTPVSSIERLVRLQSALQVTQMIVMPMLLSVCLMQALPIPTMANANPSQDTRSLYSDAVSAGEVKCKQSLPVRLTKPS